MKGDQLPVIDMYWTDQLVLICEKAVSNNFTVTDLSLHGRLWYLLKWHSHWLHYPSPFLLLIFDKVPKISEDGDQKITETSACSDDNDDNGVEGVGEIEHQTALEPQPLTVMKARWPLLLLTENNIKLRFIINSFCVIDSFYRGTLYLTMLMFLLRTTILLYSLSGWDVTCPIQLEPLGLELKPFASPIKYQVSNYTPSPAKV